jgi:hypothetical protein
MLPWSLLSSSASRWLVLREVKVPYPATCEERIAKSLSFFLARGVDGEFRYLFNQPPPELSAEAARLFIELRDMPDAMELGLPLRREAARRRRQRRREARSFAVSLALVVVTFAVLHWTAHTLHARPAVRQVGLVLTAPLAAAEGETGPTRQRRTLAHPSGTPAASRTSPRR